MPPLTVMIKPASSRCNLRCRYCFYADVTAHRAVRDCGLMSEETMRQLIRRSLAYADGSLSFAFQGGEPLLAGLPFYRAFTQEVRRQNTRRIPVHYALQTNGTLLTEDFCRFFAENGFLLGVSLDGTRAVHDALRVRPDGGGSYDDVRQKFSLLDRAGVPYNLLCVVTRPLAEQAAGVWDALKPFRYLQFIPCIDDFDREPADFSLSAEAYGRFLIAVFDGYEKAFRQGRPVSERVMDNYMALLLGMEPEHCGMRGQCGQYLLLEADGSAYPCDFYVLDEWKLGHICEDSVARLMKSGAMQRFQAQSRILPDGCRTCPWLRLCRGGCRRNREPFGDGAPSMNRFCESFRMLFEARYDRMRALAAQIRRNQSNNDTNTRK